jgi:hypothetical protein
MKHKKKLLKSAKARVTGTIPYCHGKIPHSRKLLSLLCSNDFKGVLFFSGNFDPLSFVGVICKHSSVN